MIQQEQVDFYEPQTMYWSVAEKELGYIKVHGWAYTDTWLHVFGI